MTRKTVRLALGLSISECWVDVMWKTAKAKEGIRMSIVDLCIGARGTVSRRNKMKERIMVLRIGAKGG